MKKLIIITICIGLGISLFSLEVGFSFDIGNIAFEKEDDDVDESLEWTIDDTDFTGTEFPFGFSGYLNTDISDNMGVNILIQHDPTLQYTAYTLFTFQESFFQIAVGPLFGTFNTTETLINTGISTFVKLDFPGIIFAGFRADSSLGGRLAKVGDYIQERSDISVGFYVPNAICTVDIITKSYTEKTDPLLNSGATEIIDEFSEYSFSTDIFQKNVPYRIFLTFGYQQIKKSFVTSTATAEHSLNSLFVDIGCDISFTEYLGFDFTLRSNLYGWGSVQNATEAASGINHLITLYGDDVSPYLFNLQTGFRLNIDYFTKKDEISY